MLMDGRVLHAGAVNKSSDLRYIITNSVVRPFIRQQESFHLTIRPDILKKANEKFLWRCGFQATSGRSMVEGFGYFGSGKAGDASGDLVHARVAMDEGCYERVGELTLADVRESPRQLESLTLAKMQSRQESARPHARKLMASLKPR